MNQARKWALMFCLLFPLYSRAEQFVELTAEIELNDWDYWLLGDKDATKNSASIFEKSYPVRCVVGTNTWMMEGGFSRNTKKIFWFTGTNIIAYPVASQLGRREARLYESSDGNPGRPLYVIDLLNPPGKIS